MYFHLCIQMLKTDMMNNENTIQTITNALSDKQLQQTKKQIEKYSKIKQKVKQLQTHYARPNCDPIRNMLAISSLGAIIVISTICYIYIAGILSLFFPDANFHFMREMMRILECISISIVSYFFGGIFKKEKVDKNKDM